MTTISVLDQLAAGETPVVRYRVLTGESSDPARRADKVRIAFSDCRYVCPTWAVLVACIDEIRKSDAKLRARPDDMMLWDWDNTYVEFANPAHPERAGGTVFLGVAWYHREFFDDRLNAGFGVMHQRIYHAIGIPRDGITIEHYLLAEHAAWKPELQPVG